ncbi:hypothetical protein [Phenylobacterium sp.]|uniref:hypothetical protein n=1 Tax=Phenylobacterium sp. TaxID=1871053 RepID=UPI0035AF0444
MAPRLKVFVTSDGFTDYVVAVSSRAKALAAWGAHQDLFASGGAYETDDPGLVEAALGAPGEVLRRPRQIRPVKAPEKTSAKAPRRPRDPTPAQVETVKALEAELTAQAAAFDAALAALEEQRQALEARRRDLETRYAEERARLREALRRARSHLR